MYAERVSTGTLTLRATTGDATARLNNFGAASSFKPAAAGSSVGINLGDVTFSEFSGAASTISSVAGSSYFQANDSYLGVVNATGGTAGSAYVALKNAPTLSRITFTSSGGINNIDATVAGVTLKATGSQTSTQMVVGVGGSVNGSLSQSIADGISSFFTSSEDSTYTLSTDAEDLARYFYKSEGINATNIDLGTVALINDQPVGALSLSATKGLAALLIADSQVVSKMAGTVSSEGNDFTPTSGTSSTVSVSGQSAVMYAERVDVGRINLTATSKIDLSLIDSFVLNSTTFSSLGEISSFTAGTISLQSQTAEVMLNDSYFGTLDLTKVSGASSISVLFDGSNTAIANLPAGYRPQVALKASNGIKDTIKLFETSPYSGKYTVTGFELGNDELYNNNQIISYSGNKFSNDAVTIVGSSIVIDFDHPMLS
jgi:hypothetical protein